MIWFLSFDFFSWGYKDFFTRAKVEVSPSMVSLSTLRPLSLIFCNHRAVKNGSIPLDDPFQFFLQLCTFSFVISSRPCIFYTISLLQRMTGTSLAVCLFPVLTFVIFLHRLHFTCKMDPSP